MNRSMMKSDVTLYHGDCLEEMNKISDNSVELVLVDPPYESTKFEWDAIIPFDLSWNHIKRVLKPGGVVVMTGQQPFTSQIVNSNLKWFQYEWIWDKNTPKGMHHAKQQPMRKHENVIVFSEKYQHNYYPIKTPRDKVVKSWNVMKNNQGSIGSYKDNDSKVFTYTEKNPTSIITGCWEANRGYIKYHPTQKPVSLMEYLVRTYTLEGDTVLDYCFGGGTTGVACVRTNRNFIGIEKNEEFFLKGKARIEEEQKKLLN